MSIRDDVLWALSGSDRPLSGEALAESLGVSRAAVWKAVTALREAGYAVIAAPNRGYLLPDRDQVLTEAGIRAHLRAKRLGGAIEIHRRIDSTNIRAKALAAQGAPHGTLVIADQQTQGRGRFARPFYSPPGSGLYMSAILRPALPAHEAVKLTVLAAVATARAVEALSPAKVTIKWVNDLYLGERKFVGILSEAGLDFESGQLEYCVVGIGVNVTAGSFPPELSDIATSIEADCGAKVPRAALAAEILNQMDEMMDLLPTGGFLAEYRARSNVIGRAVTVRRGDEVFDAVATGIDDDGGLTVSTPAGEATLRAGEISVRVKKT